MQRSTQIGISLIALFAATGFNSDAVEAAGVSGSECTLSGALAGGGLWGDQSYNYVVNDGASDQSDWQSLFVEASGLVTCNAANFQIDYAHYGHESDFGNKDQFSNKNEGDPFYGISGLDNKTTDAGVQHYGGAIFWRDPNMNAFGLSGSFIRQASDLWLYDIRNDYYRGGLFAEYYPTERMTMGGSVHYFHADSDIWGKDFADHNGVEFAAYAKFYPIPQMSLNVRGDYMLDATPKNKGIEVNGYAITAEVEYEIWNKGLVLTGGARYANRQLGDTGDSFEITDKQVFAGIKFYFSANGAKSLQERDRTGSYDNTSTMLEKLPHHWGSLGAAVNIAN